MIKKKLLALGVSAVAVTAVAGAGFAGWTFTTEAKKEHNLGVNITAAYSFGTVAIDTGAPDTVVLDQGNKDDNSGVTLAKSTALTTAITDVTAKWTVNATSYTANSTGLTYAVNVYINSALKTYVDCGSAGGSGTVVSDANSAYNGYTKYVVAPTTSVDTSDSTNTVVTMTLANPLVYTASKPDTFEKYQAMVAAIKDVQASTVVTDTAYEVAATAAPIVFEFTVTKAAA